MFFYSIFPWLMQMRASLSHSLNFPSLFSLFSFLVPLHTQKYNLSASHPPPPSENSGIYTVIGEALSSILWFFVKKKSFLLSPGSDYFIIFRFPDMFLAEGDKRGRLMGRKAQWLNANQTGTALGSVPTVCAHLRLHIHTQICKHARFSTNPCIIHLHTIGTYVIDLF